MNTKKRNHSNKKIEQTILEQSDNELQLQPENDFQIFFKLEFDSLNNFANQQISQLKEEIESELLHSKALLNKYKHLRQICDKKREFDQFKRWNDQKSHHHSKEHDTIEEYEYKKARSSSSHHSSHNELRHNSSHSKSYYDDYYRYRKILPEYDDRIRYYDSRMTRDLPSSQRKRTVKRTYHDDLERISQFQAQNPHKVRNYRNHGTRERP